MVRVTAFLAGTELFEGGKKKAVAFVLLAALVVAGLLLTATKPAHAASTFTVNSTGDAADNNPGSGTCYTGVLIVDPEDGVGTVQQCTLRAAIQEANQNGAADTINFHSALSGAITLSLGELVIADDIPGDTEDLIIEGPGARTMTVSGNDASRVFHINEFTDATISGLTISDGGTADYGGGIFNENGGELKLTNSTVSGNASSSLLGGGGIFNFGILTLANSTVSNNTSEDIGGGITNFDGSVSLTNSTVSNNTADYGGGIYNADDGFLKLTNTTVSNNTATSSGGGISLQSSSAYVRNTIIARNTTDYTHPDYAHPDVSGTVDGSQGRNLIGNTTGSSGWITTDLQNVNPLLSPLQNNGGPTDTHALKKGSPALNTIPRAVNSCGTEITTDQRGLKRPQAEKCDMGSFEKKKKRRR